MFAVYTCVPRTLTVFRASLSVFTEAGGMAPLRERSMGLTRFLEELLTRDDVLRNEVRVLRHVWFALNELHLCVFIIVNHLCMNLPTPCVVVLLY